MAYGVERILGIDPGIERLGWGILEKTPEGVRYVSSGVKKTSSQKRTGTRLLEIQNFLEQLLTEERLEVVVVERIFFAKNAKTALQIGEVRGVILAAAAKYKITVRELAPLEVKLAVTGYGRADKKNIYEMLKLSLKLPTKKMLDDETDAIALALAGVIHTRPFQT